MNIQNTPTFNLGVAIQETGINPDTLRAWERRYGLPQPARSEGGHRLYSARDIDTIKWLNSRLIEGMSISKAVNLWRTLESSGSDPLAEMPSPLTVPTAAPPVDVSAGAKIEELCAEWVRACLDFDEASADYIVTHAFALFPPETVLFEILFAGLSQIGDLWYQRQATVQQEHFAAAFVSKRLNALVASAPPPLHQERIVVGCPPKEEHSLSALLITYLLRSRGWNVVYLGANVPLENFQDTIVSVSPSLVVLTAQMLAAAAELKDVAVVLAEEGVHLAFGGMIFNRAPSLTKQIPGFYLGEDLRNALPMLEHLLTSTPPLPGVPTESEATEVLDYFVEMRPALEEKVCTSLGGVMPHEYLQIVNQYIAQDIIAALKFGDIAYLGGELAWIEGLVENTQIPDELMRRYWQSYYQATDEALGVRGADIVDWIANVSPMNA